MGRSIASGLKDVRNTSNENFNYLGKLELGSPANLGTPIIINV